MRGGGTSGLMLNTTLIEQDMDERGEDSLVRSKLRLRLGDAFQGSKPPVSQWAQLQPYRRLPRHLRRLFLRDSSQFAINVLSVSKAPSPAAPQPLTMLLCKFRLTYRPDPH